MTAKRRAWGIVIGGAVNNTLFTVTYVVLGLILASITDKVGVPYSTLSYTFTFINVGMLIACLFAGSAVVRLSGKLIGILTSLAEVLMLFTASFSTSVVPIYAAALLFGFCHFFVFLYFNVMVTQWFVQGASTVLSVGLAVSSLGAAIFSPLLASIFEKYGVTRGGISAALVFCVVMLLSTVFLYGNVPAKYGLAPINLGRRAKGKADSGDAASDAQAGAVEQETPEEPEQNSGLAERNMPLSRAARSSVFLLVCACGFLTAIVYQAYQANQYPIIGSFGFSTVASATVVGISLLGDAAGNFLCGFLCDKIGIRATYIPFVFLCTVSFLLAFLAGGKAAGVMLVLYVASQSYSKTRPAVILTKIYGQRLSPQLISWDAIFVTVAGIIAPFIASGLISAAGGTYRLIGYAGFAAMVLCTICMAVLTSRRSEEHIDEIDAEYPLEAKTESAGA